VGELVASDDFVLGAPAGVGQFELDGLIGMGRSPLAADISPRGSMSLSRLGDLAHREVDQRAPEDLPALRRAIGTGIRREEIGEEALQDVVGVGAGAKVNVESSADDGSEAIREPKPDLTSDLLAQEGVLPVQIRDEVGERTYGIPGAILPVSSEPTTSAYEELIRNGRPSPKRHAGFFW
jgi:hypothetical protein